MDLQSLFALLHLACTTSKGCLLLVMCPPAVIWDQSAIPDFVFTVPLPVPLTSGSAEEFGQKTTTPSTRGSSVLGKLEGQGAVALDVLDIADCACT